MKKWLNKTFLLFLAFIPGWFGNIQTLNGQSSVHDSLRHLLTNFHENAKDEKLKHAIRQAQALYGGDTMHDSLVKKLLIAEDLFMNASQIFRPMVLSYAEMLESSLRQLPSPEEHPDYSSCLNNLGNLYTSNGEYEKALPVLEHAIKIRRTLSGEHHPDYVTSLNSLGNLYTAMGDYNKALLFYQQSLAIIKKISGENDLDFAGSINNLGILYVHTGEYKKAMALFQQALAIRKKRLGEEHAEYASSLESIGNLYISMAEEEKAMALCQQALTIRKKVLGEAHPDYANSLTDIGILYEHKGHYDKALAFHQQSLLIRKRILGEEHPDYSNSLNDLAILYYLMGEYEKAMPLYQQALAITKKKPGENHPDYAASLNNLAVLYSSTGEYEKALPLLQQALVIRRKILGESHPDYAFSLNSLASLYEDIGQYEKALPFYQKAIAIRKSVLGKEHPDYANSLNSLASLYHSMEQYDKALPLYQQALAIRKKKPGEVHRDYAVSLNNLAFLYEDIGEYKKALSFYQQSLAIRKKVFGEKHPSYATNLNNLAFLYQRMGQYEKALPIYKQALAIRKKALGEEHTSYATSCNNLGLLYSSMSGNYTNAANLFIKASKIKLKHFSHTYSSLSEQEKMIFINKESFPFGFLPSLLFTSALMQPAMLQQAYANELALKGMVLEDQQHVLQSIRKSRDSAALELYEHWRLSKAFLGKQFLMPFAQRIPYLDSLEDATNELEQQLSRRSTAFNNVQHRQIIEAKDVYQNLAKDQAAVEFLRFNLYDKKWTNSIIYAALILTTGDSIARFIPLFEEKQLQRLLSPPIGAINADAVIQKLYRGVIVSGNQSVSLHDSLFELIWKPLEKHLTGINTIYYAPAGLLHRIAFQALRPDSNHLLIDKYQLNQVLSTRSVAFPAPLSPKPVSAGIWGNIQYNLQSGFIAGHGSDATQNEMDTTASSFNFYTSDTRASRGDEWTALPGTRQELDSLKNVFLRTGIEITINSDAVATEEAFKALNGRSPQLLHLATHGFFLPVAATKYDQVRQSNIFTVQQNPMLRSGLVLAGANHAWKGGAAIPGSEDGILTAYEIAQMDLINTDMIVLSACETALGDLQVNEGVIGLQRAFKMAGVKQIIMSLWRVPDKETMELMTMFYKNWLAGQSTREALRTAQLKMKEKYPPYYWAAFVLVE